MSGLRSSAALQVRKRVGGPAERDQRSRESDLRMLELRIMRHRLLEQFARRLELAGLSMHLCELVGGVRVGRIEGQLFLERLDALPVASAVDRVAVRAFEQRRGRCGNGCPAGAAPARAPAGIRATRRRRAPGSRSPRPPPGAATRSRARRSRAASSADRRSSRTAGPSDRAPRDRQGRGATGAARRRRRPDRVRVPCRCAAGGARPSAAERDRSDCENAFVSRAAPLRSGRAPKATWPAGRRLSGSAGFKLEGLAQRRDRRVEFALLEVDQPEARVHFGGRRAELAQRLVGLLRVCVASLGERALALLRRAAAAPPGLAAAWASTAATASPQAKQRARRPIARSAPVRRRQITTAVNRAGCVPAEADRPVTSPPVRRCAPAQNSSFSPN